MTSKRTAKPAAKKNAGKTAAAKKTAVKKTAVKKAATKKATARKPAAKPAGKRTAKKTAVKKTAVKKAATKKATARRPAAKRAGKRTAKKTTTTKRAATGSGAASSAKRSAAGTTVAGQPASRRAGGRRLSEAVQRAKSLEESLASRAAAKAAKRGRARRRVGFQAEMLGQPDGAALGAALQRRLADDRDTSAVFGPQAESPRPSGRRSRSSRADPAPMAFPGQNVLKWVPIGPTVTRRGQAMSRPRVSGRIRAIEVSLDGSRAYAASAKGGVWYTGDGGTTWQPVGGWASRSVNPQGNGNMFSTGALLVRFGATPATDFVMVGTGEPVPARDETGAQGQGGVGVLAATGPVTAAVDADPWEPDAGAGAMAGLGVRRLARHPASTAGSNSGGTQDRVLAATSGGLFIGTRAALPLVVAAPPPAPGQPPVNGLPARDGFTWAAVANVPTATGNDVTDVLWFNRPPGNTRIVYAVGGTGVFYSDNDGTAEVPIAALNPPGVAFNNRISLAAVPGTNRVYVLAESGGAANVASLWQIADVIAAPQAVVAINGVPADLFGDPTGVSTQAFYDHGLAVEQVAANDRIYLGGSTVMPVNTAAGEWSASLFCFETAAPPAAPTNLAAVTGISRRLDPAGGDGADRNGLIGNNVHPDVHAIALTGPAAPNRHVWVGCDGGVFVSTQGGRVNTFAARNNGLATLEPIFLANHPTSSHFVLTGFQDNGAQVRVGDTMWELTFLGDGGGTMFHPVQSHITVAQFTNASWEGRPLNVYLDPMTRSPNSGTIVREANASAFYSGAASIADSATTGRMALGTNRVWIIDNLGTGTPLRWRALPFANGTQRDARPGGSDPAVQRAFGVPGFVNANFTAGTEDNVIDMVWQTPTVLLVVYRGGIVRYTNTNQAAGTWAMTVWNLTAGLAIPANHQLTAIAAVPGSQDFYVTTLGDPAIPASDTLWFFDNATGTFLPTGFRNELDFPGPPVVVGPLDPAYAVAVDPAVGTDVYVGTATGVWKGRRQVGGNWVFAPLGNGLPSATVQDLEIWQDPAGAAGSPRLLRAGVQSRGVWEVDIAQEGGGPRPDPRRTYVRVHARDDRRILPTRMANPRLAPTAAPEVAWASPDVAIRPAWPVAAPPRFLGTITFTSAPSYELWTFQTAFRWLFPSCVADGRWSDAFRDLVRQHRATLGLPAVTVIDAALWRAVVGSTVPPVPGVRLRPDPADANHALVNVNAADQLAVFRPPWHNALNFTGHATEIDLAETIVPVRITGQEWTVYREPSTVDVLLHHRDSRPVPPGSGFAALLWQSAPTSAALQALPAAGLDQYYRDVLGAGPGAAAPAAPAGWNPVLTGGSAHHPLTTMFDARLPRAVSVDVDFSAVPDTHRVIVVALAGSGADDPPGLPTGAPATVLDAVQNYRHLAARIVRMRTRPV